MGIADGRWNEAKSGKDVTVAGNEVTKDNIIRRQIAVSESDSDYPNLPLAEYRTGYDTDGSKQPSPHKPKQNQSQAGGQVERSDEKMIHSPRNFKTNSAYYPPARALVVKGTSRMDSNLSSERLQGC